jgi:hypothetical protein
MGKAGDNRHFDSFRNLGRPSNSIKECNTEMEMRRGALLKRFKDEQRENRLEDV